MTGIEHQEKRWFQRMQLQSQLYFRRVGIITLFKGETLDLSATGIRFITTEPLENNELLQIVINNKHRQIAPLVAEGKVLRVAALSQAADRFKVSLLFTDLN